MRCLAFDLGRVVFDFDYNLALDKMKHKMFTPKEEIIEAFFYRDFTLDFEKGIISPGEFYQKFKEVFKCPLSCEDFYEAWNIIFSPNKEVINLIKNLTIAYPVYLISNINKAHFDHLYRNFEDVFSLFKGLILSYKVKSVKPEEKIYQELVSLSGFKPEEIIYIDDREDLISEAGKLGFDSIRFLGQEQLVKELKERGIYS